MPDFVLKRVNEEGSKFKITLRDSQIARTVHSEDPEVNDPALNEKNAYLTEFLDPEECDDPLADKILAFVCEAGDQCTLGDPKDRTPGCHLSPPTYIFPRIL